MRVMVIVKANKNSEAGIMPSPELIAEMGKFNQALIDAGIMLDGGGLKPSSRGARVAFSGVDRSVQRGPFENVGELAAGYWIWKVKDLDEAIDWSSAAPTRCPAPRHRDPRIVRDGGFRLTGAAPESNALFRPDRARASAGSCSSETLNDRGNIQLAQAAKEAPHVLSFSAEVVLDGRGLERPVNYALVLIVPPTGVTIDPAKPPIVVVDPRAGHGPGIGGMKSESEIGVALRAGHPVYFIGFLPNPVPGQTIEDVCRAEAFFLEEVAKRHPEAEGKPIVIANCQAGWQIMMTAAVRPELAGVIMLAGTPLSYWAGVRGKNPMRYLGGMLGGTWLTALAGDMGAGIFDGANLEFRVPQSRQYLLDQAVQRLFQDRFRAGALPRVRDLVGQPGAAQC